MMPMLLLVLAQAPGCPAEAQPEWATASAREKKAMLARCQPVQVERIVPLSAGAVEREKSDRQPQGPLAFSWGLHAALEWYPSARSDGGRQAGAQWASALGGRLMLGVVKPGAFRLSGRSFA